MIPNQVFGIRTPTTDTNHMIRLYELMEHWSKVMEIGATPPVDFYPFLKWVPERFLGYWVTRATQVKNEMDSLYHDVVEAVIKRRDSVGPRNSLLDRILDKQDKLNLTQHELYFLGGIAMEGGSDTTASGVLAFMKAMTCFPDVQKKAQAEIDAVIGEDRSPLWSDYARLPYVSQVVKESMRWRPLSGLGVPHALSEGKLTEPPTAPIPCYH
jgi:cytochrome P450